MKKKKNQKHTFSITNAYVKYLKFGIAAESLS